MSVKKLPPRGIVPSGTVSFDPNELLIDASAEPLAGDAPLAVRFTAEPVDPDEAQEPSYVWDFGDGSDTSREAYVVHIYARPGTYTATLTATDRTGKVGSEQLEIAVLEPGD